VSAGLGNAILARGTQVVLLRVVTGPATAASLGHLAGAEVDDEELAVTDLAGLGGRGDGIDGSVDLVRGDSDLDLDLGPETHGVFSAAIDFGVALLPAISLDFSNYSGQEPQMATITLLRQRVIEDKTVRNLSPATRQSQDSSNEK
jgi:hypothetical protein